MKKHHPSNERIKRRYLTFLREAKRHSESTVDTVAKALSRFEEYTRYRDFKTFRYERAVAFKKHLAQQRAEQSGQRLSSATLHATLTQLKHFFQWLAWQPGYRSRIQYADAEYFNLSEKEVRVATARRQQKAPTIEQIKHVITSMPADTVIERRNRALIATTILTGARDSAIASLKLKHVDLVENCIYQDAREVRTKFSKTLTTFFFPVGDEFRSILADWVAWLREEQLWSNDDPLFPATAVGMGPDRQFTVIGLKRAHWSNATPIRKIFHEAFTNAGLPYFNPHSFRNTLTRLGQEICRTPEQFKAWSQNLGHEQVLTTLVSYGEVACQRQGEILQELTIDKDMENSQANDVAEILLKKLQEAGVSLRDQTHHGG